MRGGVSPKRVAHAPIHSRGGIDLNRVNYPIPTSILALSAPVGAQTAQSTSGLEGVATAGTDIIVTANRAAQPADRVGQAVTVLDTVEITRRQASVVSDLLRQTPGVTVVRNGGVGTTTSVNIRGAPRASRRWR